MAAQTNFYQLNIEDLVLYYSYQTCIAFLGPDGLYLRQNDWGPTTGKHLRWLEKQCYEPPERLPGPDFEQVLKALLTEAGLDQVPEVTFLEAR